MILKSKKLSCFCVDGRSKYSDNICTTPASGLNCLHIVHVTSNLLVTNVRSMYTRSAISLEFWDGNRMLKNSCVFRSQRLPVLCKVRIPLLSYGPLWMPSSRCWATDHYRQLWMQSSCWMDYGRCSHRECRTENDERQIWWTVNISVWRMGRPVDDVRERERE